MDEIGQEEPPPTPAIVPPTPIAPTSEVVESAPKRRRIGRKTSEANLPENVIGDDFIRAAFASFLNKCVSATAGAQAHIEHEDSIVDEVDQHMRRINTRYNHWPHYMKRLEAAALATCQPRFVDVTEIEKVTTLYCAEGQHGLRSHTGTAWTYFNGGFLLFEGLPSKDMLRRVQAFVKHLEGLYKSFPITMEGPNEE